MALCGNSGGLAIDLGLDAIGHWGTESQLTDSPIGRHDMMITFWEIDTATQQIKLRHSYNYGATTGNRRFPISAGSRENTLSIKDIN